MNAKNGFVGIALGSLVGLAIGILFAPQSGEETRELIKESSRQAGQDALTAMREAQAAAAERLKSIEAQLETFKGETREKLAGLQQKDVSKQATFDAYEIVENAGLETQIG